jgi:hypothetical protein
MKSAFGALAFILLLGGCVTDSSPQYSLSGGEKGVFTSRNPGTLIPIDRIKGLDEGQLAAMFGTGVLDRKDDPARAMRYQSDACSLFVYLYRRGGTAWKAEYADAYDRSSGPCPSTSALAPSPRRSGESPDPSGSQRLREKSQGIAGGLRADRRIVGHGVAPAFLQAGLHDGGIHRPFMALDQQRKRRRT